jgi:hypothetical protein
MEFVRVALGSFSTIPAEPGIFQAEFGDKWAPVACTAAIFRNTEMALSGNAVHCFMDLPGTPVIGGAGRTNAFGLFFCGSVPYAV